MDQDQSQNQSQIMISEGAENETGSAIALNNQNLMHMNNRIAEEIKSQIENMNQPQRNEENINEEVEGRPREQNLSQINLSRASQRDISNEFSESMRFDFNRIFLDRSYEYRARYKNIVQNINKLLEYQIIIFIFLIFCCIQSSITQIWRVQYPLFVLIGYYSFDIHRCIKNYMRTNKENDPYLETIEIYRNDQGIETEMAALIKLRRKILCRSCFEDVILLFTCILLIVYSLQSLPLPSFVCVIPPIFPIIVKFSCKSWPKSQCEAAMHILSIWNSISRVLTFGFILIKIDGLIECSIALALWPYWISLVALIILALFASLLLGNSVLSYVNGYMGYQGVLGTLWTFIFFGGLTISTFSSVFGVICMFDRQSLSNSGFYIFIYIFLPLFTYIIVLFLSTLALFKCLIPCFDYYLYLHEEDEVQIQENEQPQDNLEDIENQRNRENRISTFNVSMPIIMRKISDTLFVKGTLKDKMKFERYLKNKQRNAALHAERTNTDNNLNLPQAQCSSIIDIEYDPSKIHHKSFSFCRRNMSIPDKNVNNDIKNKNLDPLNNSKSDLEINEENKATAIQPYLQLDHRLHSQMNSSKKEARIKANKRQINWLNTKHGHYSSRFHYSSKQKRNIPPSCSSINQKCRICYENNSNSVIMNCGHGGICYNCACLSFKIDNRCFFCRSQILGIFEIENQQDNVNLMRVVTITVIQEENGNTNIEEIFDINNMCERNLSREYYSDSESQIYTSQNHREIDNLSSFIINSQRMSKRNNSCTNFENPFVKHNRYISNSNFAPSQLSSCVRIDKVETFKDLNSSTESNDGRKLVRQNVLNLDLYLSSNRTNSELLKSDRMMINSNKPYFQIADSGRSINSKISNRHYVVVNKDNNENCSNISGSEENAYQDREEVKSQINHTKRNDNPNSLDPNRIYNTQYPNKLHKEFGGILNTTKYLKQFDENKNNILREKDIQTVVKHFISPKNNFTGGKINMNRNNSIVDSYCKYDKEADKEVNNLQRHESSN